MVYVWWTNGCVVKHQPWFSVCHCLSYFNLLSYLLLYWPLLMSEVYKVCEFNVVMGESSPVLKELFKPQSQFLRLGTPLTIPELLSNGPLHLYYLSPPYLIAASDQFFTNALLYGRFIFYWTSTTIFIQFYFTFLLTHYHIELTHLIYLRH